MIKTTKAPGNGKQPKRQPRQPANRGFDFTFRDPVETKPCDDDQATAKSDTDATAKNGGQRA